MTKRLAVILIVGVVAIIATYFMTKLPAEVPFPEKLNKASAGSTTPGATDSAGGAPGSAVSTGIANQSVSTPFANSSTTAAPGATVPQVPSQNLVDGFKHAITQALSIPGATPAAPQANSEFSEAPVAVMPSIIDATDKNTALLQARALAGRRDPFAPIGSTKPFPRARKAELPVPTDLANSGTKSAKETLNDQDGLPPEPGDKTANLVPDTVPVPPPPGISSDELPPPPDKPLLVRKLRLNGIVGDRAILAFNDRNYSRDNGWRPYITLGAGDRFDSIRVVSVGEESVVIEEEGKESTLQIPPIR